MSSLRQVQQGRPYQPPPAVNGLPPDPQEPLSTWQHNVTRAAALAAAERAAATAPAKQRRSQPAAPESSSTSRAVSAAAVQAASSTTILAGMTRAYMGVSPALVEQLCIATGIAADSSPDSLSPEDWQQLHQAWLGWLDKLHSKNFTPSSCPITGKYSVLGAYPTAHSSAQQLVDDYYRSTQGVEVYAALHQKLTSAVQQALKKARRRVSSFEQQLAAAEQVAAVQKEADSIIANIYR